MWKNICLGLGASLAFSVSVYAQNFNINKVGNDEGKSFNVLLGDSVVTQAPAGSWLVVSPIVPDGKVFRGFTVYDEYGNFPNQQRVSNTTKEDTRFLMPDHDVYLKASYESIRYNLVVNSTDNGKVLVTFNDRTRDRTKPGTRVTVTPSPLEGYMVESVKVCKKQDENTSIDCVKDETRTDGSCSFDMPDFDVIVSANFVSLAVSSSSAEVVSSSSVVPASSSAVVASSSSVVTASSSSVVVASSSSVAPSSSSAVPASSSAVVASSSSVIPASSSSVVVASSSSVAPFSSSAVPASSSAVVASSSSVVPASSSSVVVASSSSVAPSSSSAKPASSSAVVASSSSAKTASSSSVKASSSSAKPASSSSVKASSSSAKPASSSSKKNSSSSAKPTSSSVKSSSSVADVVVEAVTTEEDLPSCTVKRENMTYYVSSLKAVFVCHSRMWTRYNPGPNSLPIIALAPRLSVVANGRSLQIFGAKLGDNVSLFDMQGRVLYNGRVKVADFSLNAPRTGSFLLRVGTQQKIVNIR